MSFEFTEFGTTNITGNFPLKSVWFLFADILSLIKLGARLQ